VERSDRAGDQGRAYVRLLPDRLASAASVCRQLVVRCWKRSAQSSVLALSVPIPPKLRVATAQTEHMPFYLRTFLRVLSSWGHWGEIVELLAAPRFFLLVSSLVREPSVQEAARL
jgi:hypothetical protein